MDSGVLTDTLNHFLTIFNAAFGNIWAGGGKWLMAALATIEIVLVGLWWALGDNATIVNAIKKGFFLMFWLWLVANFPGLAGDFVGSLARAGFIGAGSAVDYALIYNPSAVLDYGIDAIGPLIVAVEDLSFFSLGAKIIIGLCMLIILAAFAIIAWQLFITLLEFYLFIGLSAILLPWGVFKPTKFIAEKVLGGVISFGIKLLVLAFIMAAVNPTLSTLIISEIDGTINWTEIFSMAAIAWAIALLAWNAPGIAAGLVSGAPSLTAGTALQNTVAGGVIGGMAAAQIYNATRAAALGGGQVAGSLTSAAGNLHTGYTRGAALTHGSQASKIAGGIAGAGESAAKSTGAIVAKHAGKVSDAVIKKWQQGVASSYGSVAGSVPKELQSNDAPAAPKPPPAWAKKALSAMHAVPHEAQPSAGSKPKI